jgi:hypothetical protein
MSTHAMSAVTPMPLNSTQGFYFERYYPQESSPRNRSPITGSRGHEVHQTARETR